jgi:hypothetical protein
MKTCLLFFIGVVFAFSGCSRCDSNPPAKSSEPQAASPAAAEAEEASAPEKANEPLTEAEKIERLIAAVELLTDAKFVRNGSEHSAEEAAKHLRQKLGAGGDKITTAELFIEHIASKSSFSGKPYEIRFADGRTMPAGDFFRAELEKLEKSP